MKNRKIALALASALTGVAMFATGCSEASDKPEATESTPDTSEENGTGTDTAAFDEAQALRACLREHGMDVPDLQPGENPYSTMLAPPQDADPAKWAQALEDCGSGTGGSAGGEDATGDQAAMDQQVKIAECLRGKGFDMPDPQVGPDGSRSGWQIPEGADPDKFMTALNECVA